MGLGAPVVNASISMPRPSTDRSALPWGEATSWGSSRDATDYPPHFENCGARGFIAKAELSGDALAMLAA